MTVDPGGIPQDHGPARTLGDILRHTRVSAGASIEQVEADLRIKAKYIEAIEDGDSAALPSRAYTDGFLRNYATYLGLDPAETVRRFAGENGIASAASAPLRPAPMPVQRKSAAGLSGFESRPPSRSIVGSFGRGLVALWPVALFAGLAFGGYSGFVAARDAGLIPPELGGIAKSSVPEAEAMSVADASSADGDTMSAERTERAPSAASGPERAVAAVELASLVVGAETPPGFTRPDSLSYARAGAVPYWQAKAPAVEPTDGPVSEIKLETAGLLREREETRTSRWSSSGSDTSPATAPGNVDASRIAAEAREVLAALGQTEPEVPELEDPLIAGAETAGPDTSSAATGEAEAPEVVGIGPVVTAETTPLVDPQPSRGFALYASADTWVQVQDAIGTVTYTGILSAGEVYNIPAREGLRLKTGNAGGLYIEIDGQRFGPLGSDGAVMRNVVLNPGAVRASFTLSRAASLTTQ